MAFVEHNILEQTPQHVIKHLLLWPEDIRSSHKYNTFANRLSLSFPDGDEDRVGVAWIGFQI